MHARHVVESLRNSHPARQHGDIGNEAHIAHKLIALGPGVAPQYSQLSLIRSKSENRVECGGLTGAVGADQTEDAALLDPQIDAVQRDGCSERFAEAAGFYAGHGVSVPPRLNSDRLDSARMNSTLGRSISRHPVPQLRTTIGQPLHSGDLPASTRAAEWLPKPGAILRQEISGARLAAADCERHR